MKFKLLIIALVSIMFTSCTTQEESINTQITSQQRELEKVFASIDSINTIYHIPESRAFLPQVGHFLTKKGADHLGKIAGGYIGKSAGAAVGSMSGNPVVAVGGYVVGRYVGKVVGSVAASWCAAQIFDKVTGRVVTKTIVVDLGNGLSKVLNAKKLSIDDIVSDLPPLTNSDSISFGDIHNIVLTKLLLNGDKYIKLDNTINYDLLIDDCAKYVHQLDPNCCQLSDDKEEKKKLILQTKFIEGTVKQFDNQKSESIEDFYNIGYSHLESILKIDKEEFLRQAMMDEKVGNTYINLTDSDLKKLESEIDKTIKRSKLNDDLKEELCSSNSVLASSTLLWRNIKP